MRCSCLVLRVAVRKYYKRSISRASLSILANRSGVWLFGGTRQRHQRGFQLLILVHRDRLVLSFHHFNDQLITRLCRHSDLLTRSAVVVASATTCRDELHDGFRVRSCSVWYATVCIVPFYLLTCCSLQSRRPCLPSRIRPRSRKERNMRSWRSGQGHRCVGV